ncbi:unnamed protein product [Cuscuta epithymum]|uniref:Uncharacterized protein n=1 Tax=Cuscuta epithymum TaxID=186058 RepID=A0AAV0ERI5_9ASTE|nr:unnamed protein product [Cuscuta epithymum]
MVLCNIWDTHKKIRKIWKIRIQIPTHLQKDVLIEEIIPNHGLENMTHQEKMIYDSGRCCLNVPPGTASNLVQASIIGIVLCKEKCGSSVSFALIHWNGKDPSTLDPPTNLWVGLLTGELRITDSLNEKTV